LDFLFENIPSGNSAARGSKPPIYLNVKQQDGFRETLFVSLYAQCLPGCFVDFQIADRQNVDFQFANRQNVDFQFVDRQNVNLQIADHQNVDITN
jgi:uncharacterized protein YjbI with pentapeptide repeats